MVRWLGGLSFMPEGFVKMNHFSRNMSMAAATAHKVIGGCVSPSNRKLESLSPDGICVKPTREAIEALEKGMKESQSHGGMLIVSGAGISTASGIADYRSPGRPVYNPMTHQKFVGEEIARRRYWARSMIGYGRLSQADPNDGHKALAALERAGFINHVITQNVDGLHQRAGSIKTLELHGSIHSVECLSCGGVESRSDLQERLEDHNPNWKSYLHESGLQHRPDGDIDLPSCLEYSSFTLPACKHCGTGPLKPAVIFHGGSLKQETSLFAHHLANTAHSLMILGSTLTVYSSYRIAKQMANRGRDIVIINAGPTRADELVPEHLRIPSHTSDVLRELAHKLC